MAARRSRACCLIDWSGCEDSNLGPPGSGPGALARLSFTPTLLNGRVLRGSNPRIRRKTRPLSCRLDERCDLQIENHARCGGRQSPSAGPGRSPRWGKVERRSAGPAANLGIDGKHRRCRSGGYDGAPARFDDVGNPLHLSKSHQSLGEPGPASSRAWPSGQALSFAAVPLMVASLVNKKPHRADRQRRARWGPDQDQM